MVFIDTFAYDAKVDGIYYNLSGSNATVTYYSKTISSNKIVYTGVVTIPKSITYKGTNYSVTSIGGAAFNGCSGLTSITIPNSVTSIGGAAFSGCIGLTSVTIPNSVTSIGLEAFSGCIGLTSVTIPNSVTSIGFEAFSGCIGLTSITIPNSVTSIGVRAFEKCTSLTSVNIPYSVTSIEDGVFAGCSGLTSVIFQGKAKPIGEMYFLQDVVTSIGNEAFFGCSGLTSIRIPNSVTSIGIDTFHGCSALTSITIPESVSSIGSTAFYGCSGLTEVNYNAINCNVILSSKYLSLFGGCNLLTTLGIGDNVQHIPAYAFSGCSGLASVTIPNSVSSIGNSAFYGCSGLTSVTIPDNVTTIGNSAFKSCDGISSITLPDNIISIGNGALPSKARLYVKRGSQTLLSLWEERIEPYMLNSETVLQRPSLSISTTQTTADIFIYNKYEEYTYIYNGESVEGDHLHLTKLFPDESFSAKLKVSLGDSQEPSYNYSNTFTTRSIKPTINIGEITASTARVSASYTKGNAVVTSQRLVLNPSSVGNNTIYGGTELEGTTCKITGLTPNTSNSIAYEVIVSNGTMTKNYVTRITAKTKELKLTTKQPKVVSVGNVIVAADSNLDDDETNVGFEWRRTDWTDDFASNKSDAYLYEGEMEGYIRNLNSEKLWKYRPYYTSDSGNTYYGDWVGLDPTNTSYFEPTVHTYAKVEVREGLAIIEGYVMTGTDDITEQGFEYWTVNQSRVVRRAPQSVQTITATGLRMTATLAGLQDDTTYGYRAYVKTRKGVTYGEDRSFKTPATTGIAALYKDGEKCELSKYFSIYSLSGAMIRQHTNSFEGLPRGIYIVNGKKVVVK